MKRWIAVMMVLVMSAMSLTACTGEKKEDTSQGTQSVVTAQSADLKAVLANINTQYADITGGLRELTEVADLDKYYAIPTADVKQFCAEINPDTSSAPIEIVIVEAVDSNAVENVKKALENRYQSIYSMYSSYSAEQLEVVKACKVTVSGNYVIMVVAQNYDGIMEIVNSAIGG